MIKPPQQPPTHEATTLPIHERIAQLLVHDSHCHSVLSEFQGCSCRFYEVANALTELFTIARQEGERAVLDKVENILEETGDIGDWKYIRFVDKHKWEQFKKALKDSHVK